MMWKKKQRRREDTRSVADSATAGATTFDFGSPHHRPSGGGGGGRKRGKAHHRNNSIDRGRNSQAVSTGRILFLGGLVVVASVLAVGFNLLLRYSETNLATEQYGSIAERAVESAKAIAERKRMGTRTMAIHAANANPRLEEWPFVTVDGFEDVATSLIETSDGRELGFAPLVTPDLLDDFEDFAYRYFYEERDPPFPNTTAVKPFGRGVWGLDANGVPYHETDGTTSYDSPNQILTPIIQHDMGVHPALLLNIHFGALRGEIIDGIIECSEKRKDDPEVNCGGISDMVILTSQEVEPGPGAIIMQPVYPRFNSTVMAGVVASTIVWDETLQNIFSSEVTGIHCVLKTETQTYTYYIENGIAVSYLEGDRHDTGYDDYRWDIFLTDPASYNRDFSASYTLELYPTEEFFAIYRTKNPLYAALGAFLCIVLTTIAFVLYDFYVRKEFHAKGELLDAKRKFVRFVSHEVRTPLNSVSMGLSLLKEEMGAALGLELGDGPICGNHRVDEANATEWLGLTEEVMVNTKTAIGILNDLLNYDKIELKTLTLEHTIIPIWKLIESMALEFKLPASAKNVSLSLHLAGMTTDQEIKTTGSIIHHLTKDQRNRKVVGDVSRLTQVIRNLLSNALKFNDDGGKIRVLLSWEDIDDSTEEEDSQTFTLKDGEVRKFASSGFLSIAVTDTGAGMSEDQLEDLFQEGVQFNVNELQAGQGSGLGLYISKGIVEQHGGTLDASSDGIGLGTTFTMRLPLFWVPELPPVTALPEDEESPDVRTVAPPTRLSILIVDDSATNRKLLGRLLRNHGHDVVEAVDGKDGVDKMERARSDGKPYDSILMDYEMPVMNGPAACRMMRSLGCDAVIVGISGNVMTEDVEYFKRCGANRVLPKPFRLADLDQLWMEHGLTS